MQVVATAGHVDHGKSTLLRALTGMEPDRWDEEQARGLTIDLGFVWADLTATGPIQPGDSATGATGELTAFVDVPGHERFIANMLAGAGAVRLALFVVAADDGWSAQSQEHLDILDLLGVGGAVVAITKAAAAGEERALEVAADVEERLSRTTLGGAPIVVTDALTGSGIDELRTTLIARLAEVPPLPDVKRARLWIDRSFTIGGAGTVVTGTLAGGALRSGDAVALLPSGRAARIRGLHALGRAEEMVRPGARVAVNLAGVDRDEVGRGDALVTGASDPATAWLVTDRIDTWVRVLPGQQVEHTGAWHVHVGSAEALVSVHPLLGEAITGGASGWVRLLLDRPLPLQTGDRFVLREAGRQATVGGGEVIDPQPPGRVRGIDQRIARSDELDAILAADDRLIPLVAAWGGARPAADTLAAAGMRPDAALPEELTRVGDWLVTTPALARWRRAVTAAAEAHHANAPESPGPDRVALADAATGAGAPEALARTVPDHLAAAGQLRRTGSSYALPSHVPAVDEAIGRRREALLALLARDPLAPPKLGDASREVGVSYQEVQVLLRDGELVRCGEFAFLRATVEGAVARLRTLQTEVGPFTASQAREAWATSRKYAIPLLEHLDGAGVTRFDGTTRTVRPRA